MTKKYTLLCLAILFVVTLFAAESVSRVGTAGAQFLKIRPGARAIGMGGAQVAVVNDPSAIFWNPAGLVNLQSNMEMNFTHIDWLADAKYNYISGAMKVPGVGVLGLSLQNLAWDDEEITTIEEQNGTGEFFSMGDIAVNLAYARSLTDKFSFGIVGKYVHQEISDYTAEAVAFNLGTFYKTGYKDINIGMSISNFGADTHFEGTNLEDEYVPDDAPEIEVPITKKTSDFPLPLNFRIGVSSRVFDDGTNSVLVAADLNDPYDGREQYCFGAEYSYSQMVFARAGYMMSDQDGYEYGLTFGAGAQYALNNQFKLKLDYAYNAMDVFDSIHRFTLGVGF